MKQEPFPWLFLGILGLIMAVAFFCCTGILGCIDRNRDARIEAEKEAVVQFLSENDKTIKVVGIYTAYVRGSAIGTRAVVEGIKTKKRCQTSTNKLPVIGDIWKADVDSSGDLYLKEIVR